MNWQTHNSCTISSTEQPMRCVATTSGRQHAHYFKNLYEISVFILSMCCLSLSSSLSFCFVLTIGVLVQINKKKINDRFGHTAINAVDNRHERTSRTLFGKKHTHVVRILLLRIRRWPKPDS